MFSRFPEYESIHLPYRNFLIINVINLGIAIRIRITYTVIGKILDSDRILTQRLWMYVRWFCQLSHHSCVMCPMFLSMFSSIL